MTSEHIAQNVFCRPVLHLYTALVLALQEAALLCPDYAVSPSVVLTKINEKHSIRLKIRKLKFWECLPEKGKYLLLSSIGDHYDFIDCDRKLLVLTADSSREMQLNSPEATRYLKWRCLFQNSGRGGFYRLNLLGFR